MKAINPFRIILIMPLHSLRVYSQKQGREQIDSLLKELPTIKTVTAKINAWLSLSTNF